MSLPPIRPAGLLSESSRILYVAAIGFERRGEDWLKTRPSGSLAGSSAVLFRYDPVIGTPREPELLSELRRVGIKPLPPITANVRELVRLEDAMARHLARTDDFDEVIIDISTMSKLLIMLSVCKLRSAERRIRFVYTELESYAPSREEFEVAMAKGMAFDVPLPSRGIESVVRTPALSSIRMQGQPVTLVAFTSFNEQLVRHVVASISPHQLILYSGVPPRADMAWREGATQQIHQSVIDEYRQYNPVDKDGRLVNRVSTLYYEETYGALITLYRSWGNRERIMAAATGSKMQTLGLAIAKQVLPDIHIEYPTPKSYYVNQDNPHKVAGVHEVTFDHFRDTIDEIRRKDLAFDPGPCFT